MENQRSLVGGSGREACCGSSVLLRPLLLLLCSLLLLVGLLRGLLVDLLLLGRGLYVLFFGGEQGHLVRGLLAYGLGGVGHVRDSTLCTPTFSARAGGGRLQVG